MCLLFEFSRVEFCARFCRYFTIVSPKSFNYTACRRAGGRFKEHEQRLSHSVNTKSDKSEIQVSFEFLRPRMGNPNEFNDPSSTNPPSSPMLDL